MGLELTTLGSKVGLNGPLRDFWDRSNHYGGKSMGKVSLMLLLVIVLVMGCTQENHSVKPLETQESRLPTPGTLPPSVTPTTPLTEKSLSVVETEGKTASRESQPSTQASSSPINMDWVGSWSWDQANDYFDSSITIFELVNGNLTFNLDAHQITNPEKTNVNTGNIDKGIAVMKDSKAEYTDGKFKLEMRLMDGKLHVTANEGEVGYFGAGVVVSGTYSKTGDHFEAKMDYSTMDLCRQDESLLFGFPMKDSEKLLSLCAATDKSSMTYRYGRPNQVELEFPGDRKNSWQQFEYSYYFRGGGDGNEGLDLNTLTFTTDGYSYKIYDEYYSKERSSSVGIRVTNQSTKKVTDLVGLSEKKQGSLVGLKGSLVKAVPWTK